MRWESPISKSSIFQAFALNVFLTSALLRNKIMALLFTRLHLNLSKIIFNFVNVHENTGSLDGKRIKKNEKNVEKIKDTS